MLTIVEIAIGKVPVSLVDEEGISHMLRVRWSIA